MWLNVVWYILFVVIIAGYLANIPDLARHP